MSHYQKTALGIDVLQQRHIPLNARQRRLLVLIGTNDFEQLAEQFKQRIATPEIIEQLIELGLIRTTQARHTSTSSQTHLDAITTTHTPNIVPQTLPVEVSTAENTLSTHSTTVEAVVSTPAFKAFNFEETRELMINLLQRYCGLMARQLILQIQTATDLHSLKRCQMQWITTLQESRIEPALLNQHLQQINHSLLRLQAA